MEQLGKPITRARALEIAKETLERAEQARQEPDPDEGLFFMHNGKEYCDEGSVVARLLENEVLFCLPCGIGKEEIIGLFVNCNDLFAWGCADSEPVTLEELPVLFRMYKAGPSGADKWCCKKRNLQPQRAVVKSMKKAGTWEAWMDDLEENPC